MNQVANGAVQQRRVKPKLVAVLAPGHAKANALRHGHGQVLASNTAKALVQIGVRQQRPHRVCFQPQMVEHVREQLLSRRKSPLHALCRQCPGALVARAHGLVKKQIGRLQGLPQIMRCRRNEPGFGVALIRDRHQGQLKLLLGGFAGVALSRRVTR